jgi:hypothetical protein
MATKQKIFPNQAGRDELESFVRKGKNAALVIISALVL